MALLRWLPAIAAGTATDPGGLVRSLLVRIGLVALARIRDAFVIKSHGGTDDCGLRWAALSPKTIAYKRRHPVINRQGKATKRYLPRSAARAPYAPSYMLTKKERERWWALYKSRPHRTKEQKHFAAALAWIILKKEGARTLMQVYGGMTVDILRDTGLLLNSLSPGVPAMPGVKSAPKKPDQVFRVGRTSIIVGTSRKWAHTHHRGVPGRIPQRRLWARPSQWPASWWNDMLTQAQQGFTEIAAHLATKG